MPSVLIGRSCGSSLRVEQVALAQLDGVQAEPGGGHVEQVLARRRALEPARRPVGAARRLVGEHHPDPAAVGGHPVGAGEHGHGELGHRDAVGAAVGPVVLDDVVGQGQDPAAGVEGGRDPVVLLPGVVHRHQVLGPVLGPLDRAAEPQGQPGDRGSPRGRTRRGRRTRRPRRSRARGSASRPRRAGPPAGRGSTPAPWSCRRCPARPAPGRAPPAGSAAPAARRCAGRWPRSISTTCAARAKAASGSP